MHYCYLQSTPRTHYIDTPMASSTCCFQRRLTTSHSSRTIEKQHGANACHILARFPFFPNWFAVEFWLKKLANAIIRFNSDFPTQNLWPFVDVFKTSHSFTAVCHICLWLQRCRFDQPRFVSTSKAYSKDLQSCGVKRQFLVPGGMRLANARGAAMCGQSSGFMSTKGWPRWIFLSLALETDLNQKNKTPRASDDRPSMWIHTAALPCAHSPLLQDQLGGILASGMPPVGSVSKLETGHTDDHCRVTYDKAMFQRYDEAKKVQKEPGHVDWLVCVRLVRREEKVHPTCQQVVFFPGVFRVASIKHMKYFRNIPQYSAPQWFTMSLTRCQSSSTCSSVRRGPQVPPRNEGEPY